MKTKRDFIDEIKVNEANFKYCAETGIINGTLLIDIENAMQKYTDQQLLLHGVSQQRVLLQALKGIIQCCDGNEPKHEQIYHIANDAVKACNCG